MLSNTVKDKLGHSDLVSSLADDITDEEDEGSSMSQAVGRQAKQVTVNVCIKVCHKRLYQLIKASYLSLWFVPLKK